MQGWAARAARGHGAALLLAAGLLAAAATPAWADARPGLADFEQGRFAEAAQRWQQEAEAGDAQSALYMGVLYDTGIGVVQDYAQALRWYQRAADGGSVAAMFNLGVMHDAGRGVSTDLRQAASWYARAAAHGFGRAEYDLAMLYEQGDGVPRSRARAAELYARAARHGVAEARVHLVRLGQAVPAAAHAAAPDSGMRDFEQAEQILLHRSPGELSRAAELFRRAAAQGNPLAEYNLGYCLEHGLGVPRDPTQAYAWYRRAFQNAADDRLRTIALSATRGLEDRMTQLQPPPPSQQPR